jgi:hypothetical protein
VYPDFSESGSRYNDHIRTHISMNSTLYHDTDILTFSVRLYHVGVPLLFGRSKDLGAACSIASFKATFVAPYYLTPFILTGAPRRLLTKPADTCFSH